MSLVKLLKSAALAVILLAMPNGAITFPVVNAQEAQPPVNNYARPSDNTGRQKLESELILEARLTKDGEPIERGLVWRVFSARADAEGKLPVVGSGKGGTTSFSLPSGTYLVHTSFGRAGATKRITLGTGGAREVFVLNAGGLKLNAMAGNRKIVSKNLLFSIFTLEGKDTNNPKAIARNVSAGRIVRLNAGTYHVVSEYGKINATVRADLRVTAGKLTEATLLHRAAEITLKLVSEKGGEAIADTAWSVVSEQGDKILESTNTFPKMVLSNGDYTASAINGGEVYTTDFKVVAGKNSEIEVLASK